MPVPFAIAAAVRAAASIEVKRQIFGEGVAGLLADDHAQTNALHDVGIGAADYPVFHRQAVAALMLKVEICSVGAVCRELGHHTCDHGLIYTKPLHEWVFGRRLGNRYSPLNAAT